MSLSGSFHEAAGMPQYVASIIAEIVTRPWRRLFKKIFFEKGEKKMQVSGDTWDDVYDQDMEKATSARMREETVPLQNELAAAHSRLDAQEDQLCDVDTRLGGVMCEMQSIENNLDVFKKDGKNSVELLLLSIKAIANTVQLLERTVHDLKYQRADGPLDKLITAVQVPIAPPEIDLTKNSGKSV